MVYFVKMGETDYIKIGWSLNVKKRIMRFQNEWPLKPILLGEMSGDRMTEYGIHRHLQDYRVDGKAEWFLDCPFVRAFIGRCIARGAEYTQAVG